MIGSDNVVSLDKRDLFDWVRSAIKDAMLEQGSRMDDAELYADATHKANECLRDLYATDALIAPKPDGGPAFGEFQQAGNCSIKNGGMSLRDYFAAKAAQSGCHAFDNMSMEDIESSIPVIARIAYAMADAMLAERAK